MLNRNTKEYFEHLAETGEWPSRYDPSNVDNYNFITRRESVRQILDGDVFTSVLDLGCGTGDYFELLSHVAKEYVGVDFSSTMIKKASLIYGNSGAGAGPVFLEGSAESLPFDENRFDLICAIGFIEYSSEPVATMREIVRVLKPGGTLVMQSFQIDFFRKVSRVLGLNVLRRIVKALYGRIAQESPVLGFSTNRPYSRDALDQLMETFQFVNAGHLHNNFRVLPSTVSRIVPRASIYCSEALTRWQPSLLSIFAVNYVGRYTLVRKS